MVNQLEVDGLSELIHDILVLYYEWGGECEGSYQKARNLFFFNSPVVEC